MSLGFTEFWRFVVCIWPVKWPVHIVCLRCIVHLYGCYIKIWAITIWTPRVCHACFEPTDKRILNFHKNGVNIYPPTRPIMAILILFTDVMVCTYMIYEPTHPALATVCTASHGHSSSLIVVGGPQSIWVNSKIIIWNRNSEWMSGMIRE